MNNQNSLKTEENSGNHKSYLSLFSTYSILSIASTGSILSIASTGSILSIGSMGSILSIGSFGSILSILSAFSFRGRWSFRKKRRQTSLKPNK
ncbi:MAG: hypothetical protein ACPG7F_13645 [Aggregatilineales bacterium]